MKRNILILSYLSSLSLVSNFKQEPREGIVKLLFIKSKRSVQFCFWLLKKIDKIENVQHCYNNSEQYNQKVTPPVGSIQWLFQLMLHKPLGTLGYESNNYDPSPQHVAASRLQYFAKATANNIRPPYAILCHMLRVKFFFNITSSLRSDNIF